MLIQVYHLNPANEKKYDLVLDCYMDNAELEDIYRWTNSIDYNWWENFQGNDADEFVKLVKENTRSTSVDDIIVIDSTHYRVASAGFEKIK